MSHLLINCIINGLYIPNLKADLFLNVGLPLFYDLELPHLRFNVVCLFGLVERLAFIQVSD